MGDPAFFYASSTLGDSLTDIYDDDFPASKEFLYIGHEVKDFHASYLAVRTYLHEPGFVSADCTTLIRNIYNGVQMICDDLSNDVREFYDQDRRTARHSTQGTWAAYTYALGGKDRSRKARNKRIEQFLRQKRYGLQRSQMRYGNMLFKLILAVFAYAQYIHQASGSANFPDTSSYLINDLHGAMHQIRRRERRAARAAHDRRTEVEASWWWDGLPPHAPDEERPTPLEKLAAVWVNPEARLAARPAAGVRGYQILIQQLRAQNQEQGIEIRRLKATTREQADTIAELRQTVDELQREVQTRIVQLQSERIERERQEILANRYRSQRDMLLAQARETSPETQYTGRPHHRGNPEPQDEYQERFRHRSTQRQSAPRSSARGAESAQYDSGPPISYENARDRRRSSKSSRRSSGSSTAVEGDQRRYRSSGSYSPKEAPDIRRHTRPWRTVD